MNQNVVAFIPARCGSKSIKLKNIKPFNNKPLIYWNLNELQNSHYIKEIIVATDCDEIKQTVESFNFNKVNFYDRSTQSSTDSASTESVIEEYIRNQNISGNIILVQITSPFTKKQDYESAINNFNEGKFDSLLSVVEDKRFYWNKNGESINYDYKSRPRRQDFEGQYVENGAFYIFNSKDFMQHSNRLFGKIGLHKMPEHTRLELDEPEDWLLGEYLHRIHNSSSQSSTIKLLATDVDGVLTDGSMYYTNDSNEFKRFSTYDGKAFEILRNNGIKTAIITSEQTTIVENRARKISSDYLAQGVTGLEKLDYLKSICKQENIELNEVAYVGDDINCVPTLQQVGFPFCPKNARPEVKELVPNITEIDTVGGYGVIRDVLRILKIS